MKEEMRFVLIVWNLYLILVGSTMYDNNVLQSGDIMLRQFPYESQPLTTSNFLCMYGCSYPSLEQIQEEYGSNDYYKCIGIGFNHECLPKNAKKGTLIQGQAIKVACCYGQGDSQCMDETAVSWSEAVDRCAEFEDGTVCNPSLSECEEGLYWTNESCEVEDKSLLQLSDPCACEAQYSEQFDECEKDLNFEQCKNIGVLLGFDEFREVKSSLSDVPKGCFSSNQILYYNIESSIETHGVK